MAGSDMLLETFRRGVARLVDLGLLVFECLQGGTDVPESLCAGKDAETVYFDNLYYFFTKSAFQKIGDWCRLDGKALLFIKQQLVIEGVVRQYRTASRRRSELETDIFVGKAGRKSKLSVFAIKKEFWDAVGGIALYERGIFKMKLLCDGKLIRLRMDCTENNSVLITGCSRMGKTFFASNLARQLMEEGHIVHLVDLGEKWSSQDKARVCTAGAVINEVSKQGLNWSLVQRLNCTVVQKLLPIHWDSGLWQQKLCWQNVFKKSLAHGKQVCQ